MGVERLIRRIPPRFTVPGGVWLVYIVAYGPLHSFLGVHTGITAFLPVVATAWCGGALAGAAAGLITVPLTVTLATIFVAPTTASWLSQPALVGAGAMVLVGAAVGWMRDMNVRTGEQISERQRAEVALRDSESRSRDLLEQHCDGIAVLVRGKMVYVNPTLSRMMGYSADELVGKSPPEVLTPEDRERATARIRDLADGAPLFPSEYTVLRKDGTRLPVEVLSRKIQYGGQPAILSTLRDLTHRKEAERAVQNAESKYRSVVEHSLAGVYILQDGRYSYVNPTFARIVGYTQDEILAFRKVPALTIDEDKPMAAEHIRRRLEREVESVNYSMRIRRKDGRVIYAEVHGGRTLIDGRPAIVGTLVDVTERRKVEDALRTSEKRFRTVFEQAPFGILVTDSSLRIAKANRAICGMLGYREEELAGRTAQEITHPDEQAALSTAQDSVRAGKLVSTVRRYLKKNGGELRAAVSVSAVRDDAGHVLYAIVMIEDITERTLLEEQLRQTHRLESVGQLAGGVAHNFNNALTAIFGYSELLARRFGSKDPAMKDLEQIQRVAEQSATLTRQLLTFSRKHVVRPTVFCLNEAVETARDLLSPLIGDHIRLRFRLDRNLGCVRADRSQIEQVVTNLVLNARDAMPDGGNVTIQTKGVTLSDAFVRTHPDARPGPYVRLTVIDTGTGMDESTRARVFEPFFTTKEPGEGVGLGLAMVHGAVKQSGGFLTVQSEVGVGSTFILYLPESDDLDEHQSDAATQEREAATH